MAQSLIRKLADDEPAKVSQNNQCSPWFLFRFLFDFLSRLPSVMDCDLDVEAEINPYLSRLLVVRVSPSQPQAETRLGWSTGVSSVLSVHSVYQQQLLI